MGAYYMATDAKILATKRAGRLASPKRSVLTSDEARRTLQELIKPELGYIVETAIEQAKGGDSDARNFLFDRAYGKAAQSVEVSQTIEHKYSGQVNVAVLTAELVQRLKGDKLA